jgi:3-deoxy-7-phosphoheptulonate synthase
MVDCSHGNSSKDYRRQPEVAADISAQLVAGNGSIFGVMMESHLVSGRQELKPGCALTYGQSITDACLGWEETVPVLRALAAAVRSRRSRR